MLITELAYFLLIAAFIVCIFQIIVPVVGIIRKQISLQRYAFYFSGIQLLLLLCSFFGLMAGFYFNDFSLRYVVENSNSLLPWYYKLSATWAGHEGSLLLWVILLSLWAWFTSIRNRILPQNFLVKMQVVFAIIQLQMLGLLIFYSSPFKRVLIDLPIDGADLNPLLQDPALIFHPPILYTGYVGMVVPFVFCIVVLWQGEMQKRWLRWLRPWVLLAWGFLTVGIALGSWWAYYELGWGGWWFWDPVENASLLPWLVATALIHALAVSQVRGVLKIWSVLLALLAYAFSIFGTFLVRSGVLSSVHSFAVDPTRGVLLLIILALTIGSGLLLFVWRGHLLISEQTVIEKPSYQLKSRESLLSLNTIIIMVAVLVVLLGTLYPIILDAFDVASVSVGAPYFNSLFVPLVWLMLLIMGIGSVMRWQADKRDLLSPSIKVMLSSVLLSITIVTSVQPSKIWHLFITLLLVFWVIGWMCLDIYHKIRVQADSIKTNNTIHKHSAIRYIKNFKHIHSQYWAMQLAHAGVLCISLAIVISTTFSIEKEVILKEGEVIQISAYQFRLASFENVSETNYDSVMANVQLIQDDTVINILQPEKRTYTVSKMPITESAIYSSLVQDIYVALGEPIKTIDEKQQWAVRIYIKPAMKWLWIGALMLALATVISAVGKWRLQMEDNK